MHQALKKSARILTLFGFLFSSLFTLFTIPAYATHSNSGSVDGRTGEEICRAGDNQPDRGGPPGGSPPGGFGGGAYVPVKDFEAEAYLKSIESYMASIEFDVGLVEGDTQAVRYYLRELCEKEYSEDHTIQHAWAGVIGTFVNTTKTWVQTAFQNNPVFLENPYIYYDLVDKQVLYTLLVQIDQSNIGSNAKIAIAKTLQSEAYSSGYPYSQDFVALDTLPQDLSEDFNAATDSHGESGQDAFIRLMAGEGESIDQQIVLARQEWGNRRAKTFGYEDQKLAWGRGFFSFEICDLETFSQIISDRRNCRIVTPGSLIQDEVSFVFGSALRQMENADEFEEWVAPNTLAVLNDVLNGNGLATNRARTGESTAAAGPTELRNTIQPGPTTGIDSGNPNRIPFEFSSTIFDYTPDYGYTPAP